MTAENVVRASGCVVWRRVDSGPEVLVVHRQRYDDWSFPKGKLDPGETDEECALRELEEETGLVASLGAELKPARYVDHKGRDKIVRYWLIDFDAAGAPDPAVGFTANDEVDVVVWWDVAAALRGLTYVHDCGLVEELSDSFPG